MTNKNFRQLVSMGAFILLIIAITGTVYYSSVNADLHAEMDNERLEFGKLSYLKSDLEKQLLESKRTLASFRASSEKLTKDLEGLSKQKAAAEKKIQILTKAEGKLVISTREMTKLKGEKVRLEAEIIGIKELLSNLERENTDLSKRIAKLEAENRSLMERVELLAAMVLDRTRVEATRGKKNKLTVLARKTNILSIGFDLPASLTNEIKFRIITPSGIQVKDMENISRRVIESDALVASLSPLSGHFELSKRIEMTYKPKERLEPGIYSIEISNDSLYMGSCQVKLR